MRTIIYMENGEFQTNVESTVICNSWAWPGLFSVLLPSPPNEGTV